MGRVYLYFENGLYLEADSFGAEGTETGEVVFNTSLTGYQEIVTDPSYAGQFITFTMPEIGNVGCNRYDMESSRAFCKGVIVRSYQEIPSNFRAEESLGALLKRFGVMGISNIDTRAITKMLRDEGSMEMVASTEIFDREKLSKILKSSPKISQINYIKQVSTKERYKHKNSLFDFETFSYSKPPKVQKRIFAYDFGVKRGILNQLTAVGIEVEVIPSETPARDIIDSFKRGEIDGLFLSNGPGDPLILKKERERVGELIEAKVPMFGICLGHQILSIAHGYETYKLKFGHHGGNHPVKCLVSEKIEITAQNHNYNVPKDIENIADVTHINLFDNTIEGLKYKSSPIISFQHHPEASPGPLESSYIFREFKELI
jgi:carbamoyl-phosphate synthase small subunit